MLPCRFFGSSSVRGCLVVEFLDSDDLEVPDGVSRRSKMQADRSWFPTSDARQVVVDPVGQLSAGFPYIL